MEQEKKQSNSGFEELSQEAIETSTVFSKPAIVDKKPPKKRNGKLATALKLLLAPVVIAAVCFGIYFIRFYVVPPQEEEETSSEVVDETQILVTNNAADAVKNLTVVNENGTFEFYSVKSTVDSDDDEEADKVWYIKGLDKEYTDIDFTALTVGDCASFIANEIYDSKTEIDFSKPASKIEVDLEKGEDYSITISKVKGEDSNMGGAYAKVSGDDNIYFLKKEFVEYFTHDMIYYIDYVAPTAIDKTDANSEYFGEGLERFDYIKLSGKDVREEYRFEMYEKESGDTKYKMVSPYEFKVENDSMNNIVSFLEENLDNTGIMGILYYASEGLSEKTLKKYGLDEPAAVVEYKVADEVVTIRLQDIKVSDPDSDEYEYSMIVGDAPVIYRVTKNSFDFFDWEVTDFISDAVIEEDISEVSRLTLSLDNKEYLFEMKTETAVDEETQEETTVTTVSYDGKSIDYTLFGQYYGFITSVKPFASSVSAEKPKNAEKYFDVKVENIYEEAADSKLSVYKLKDNESRYYIELDGKPVGLCQTAEADKIAENITKLIKNKEF